jgi:hypothetical protein
MYCQYCNQRISIFKLLKGEPFCSKEHRELYVNTQSSDAIKRLLSSFTEEDESKQPLKPPLPIKAPVPEPSLAVAIVNQPEPAAATEVTENQPPEASFLPTPLPAPRPAPHRRPSSIVSSSVLDPTPAPVQLPVSPAPVRPPVEAAPEAPPPVLTTVRPEIAAAEPPPDVVASETAWISAREEERPSIVPASATQVLVLKESELLPLAAGQPQPSESQLPVPEANAIPAALETPALLSPALDHSLSAGDLTPEESSVFAPPPLAPGLTRSLEPSEAPSRPAPLATVGALRPRAVAPRTLSWTATSQIHADLDAFTAMYDVPATQSAPQDLPAILAAPILPELVAHGAPIELFTPLKSRSLAALVPPAPGEPLECAPKVASVGADWLPKEVAAPRVPPRAALPLAATSVSPLAGPISVARLKTAEQPPVFSAASFLAASLPLRAPAFSFASHCSTLPLWSEAAWYPQDSLCEQRKITPLVDFRPSRRGLLSLVMLPEQLSGPQSPARLTSAGSLLLAASDGTSAYSLPLAQLQHASQPLNVAAPRPERSTWRPTPAACAAPSDLASRTLDIPALGTVLAAPLPAATTQRLAAGHPGAAAASTMLPTATTALPIGPAVPAGLAPSTERVCSEWQRPSASFASARPSRAVYSAPLILSSDTTLRPVGSEETLWTSGWSREQQNTHRLAHLLASRPSPLSLVAVPHARALSSSTPRLAHRAHAAHVELHASQSRTPALQPVTQGGTYGRRMALPRPSAPTAASALPVFTVPKPPVLTAIRPSSAGTNQLRLAAVRVQPASMPALPALSQLAAPGTTLPASGPSVEPATGPAALSGRPTTNWEIRTRTLTVLPSLRLTITAPAMRHAPYSEKLWSHPAVPPPQHSTVQALSSRQRLARAITTGIRSFFPLHS